MLHCTVSLGKQLLQFRRVGDAFSTLWITYLATLCDITEDLNLQRAHCKRLTSSNKLCSVVTSVGRYVNLCKRQGKTRKDGARPALFHISCYFVLFGCYLCCSMYCLCVNVYCHRVTTQLQLINISYQQVYRQNKLSPVLWLQETVIQPSKTVAREITVSNFCHGKEGSSVIRTKTTDDQQRWLRCLVQHAKDHLR